MATFSDVDETARNYWDGKYQALTKSFVQNEEQFQLQKSLQNMLVSTTEATNEGGNKLRNFVGEEVVRQGARPTIQSWCEQPRLLESESIGRWMEITEEGADYKQKNETCITLDRILMSLVKKYKVKKLTNDQYFDEASKAIRQA